MDRAGKFRDTGRYELVKPFIGDGVTDLDGLYHEFETDPNRLYEIEVESDTPFDIHYEIIDI